MSLRYLGYLLITVGFLGGSFEVVRQVEGVDTASFLVWLSVGIVGVIVAQRARKAEATDVEVITTNVRAIETSLEALSSEARRLNEEKAGISVYDLRHRIDERFMADLVRFVDSYGLKAYAEVMNRFAAGERSLNRVWSASTDGYVDETSNYLEKAATHFAEALATFRTIKATGGQTMQEPR